jgi:tRNA G18 (ribose-2'-O)-methylase SpoU
VALVLGNEVIGVDAQVLELCDRIVEVSCHAHHHHINRP